MLLRPDDLIVQAADVHWDLALVKDIDSLAPAELPGTCTVLGWERTEAKQPAVRRALVARDKAQLDALYRQEALALVDLRAESPFTPDSEELSELERHGIDSGHLQRLREARTRYTLTTNASRNDLSEELQTHLWILLGVLTDGLCEDPQEGRFVDAAEATDDTA
jgi:hypothetical protein